MATATESTAVATQPSVMPALGNDLQTELATIEGIVSECALSTVDGAANFSTTVKLARGMKMLRKALTPAIMADIVELQGSSLGFRTDKDLADKPYPLEVVKDCLIEATLRGARPVGNEFNIISARAYMTKEFFMRKVREFPGLTDLKLMPGVPVGAGEKGSLVPFVVTWKMGGTIHKIERLQVKLADGTFLDERIPVRVNSGMGADAVIGKATRKILAAVYARLTGSDLTDGDVDDVSPAALPAPSTLGALTESLSGNGTANGNGNGAAKTEPAAETKTEATAPETQPAADAGEPNWPEIVTGHKQALLGLHSINDAKRSTMEAIAKYPDMPDEVRVRFQSAADMRVADIKAARGDGSNK